MDIITPLEAHRLIQFESDESRRPGADSTAFLHPTGALADIILAQPHVDTCHRFIFSKRDSVNAIALAAATISMILAATASGEPGFLGGLGLVLCGALVNVVVPVQARFAGRKQQTAFARYFVSLCEGIVVSAGIVWARNDLPVALLLVALWIAMQDGVISSPSVAPSRMYRARALDMTVLIFAVAIGGGRSSMPGAVVSMTAAATASLCASLSLASLFRAAGLRLPGAAAGALSAGAGSGLNVLAALLDVELILFSSGFSRFVVCVGVAGAIFGGSNAYTVAVAFVLVALAETFRSVALSRSLNTPFFTEITTVFCDGVFDLCHIGHKNLVNFAATQGNRVVVGVISDEDCSVYKRPPVMTAEERCTEVRSLMNVSRVVVGAPCFGLTEEFLRQEGIDCVIVGEEYMTKPIEEDKYYHVARRLGIAVCKPRTSGVSTSALIARIAKRSQDDLVAKDKLSGDSTVKE